MKAGLVLILAVCLAGCVVQHTGPAQHDFQAVERDNAEYVNVNLKMGAGTLRIDTGTDKLAAADFMYNIPAWKPDVRYDKSADHGTLTIAQPDRHGPHLGRTDYEWDLRLNREVPLNLNVEFGAGEGHLDVGGLALRGVDIKMGVGRLDLDLRGTPRKSYDVSIHGGVGEAIVHLPSEVGVEAEAHGGIGSIEASRLRRDGSRYYNDAWDEAKVRIHLDVHGGVGSIRLLSE
ncbi:MAG TPA: toast rack family protein [Bryobacteraceae bacterium]|nr:toast rack family protein [Bryobacteraceae bacterium]